MEDIELEMRECLRRYFFAFVRQEPMPLVHTPVSLSATLKKSAETHILPSLKELVTVGNSFLRYDLTLGLTGKSLLEASRAGDSK